MNETLRMLMALIAGVLCGALIGWFALPADGPVHVAPVDRAADAPTPAPGPARARPGASPTAPAQPMPEQRRVIKGFARLSDGTPCAGLPLVAEPVLAHHYGTVDLQHVTTDMRRAQHVETLESMRRDSRGAVTAADGSFEITDLKADNYLLFSNDRRRPLTRRPWPCSPGDELELVVRPALFIQLELSREDGGVLPGANVNLHAGDGESRQRPFWRPGIEYEVYPGRWHLNANGGPENLFSAQVEFEVPEGGPDGPLKVVLKAPSALVIRLVVPAPYYADFGVRLVPEADAPEGWPRAARELIDYSMRGGISWEGSGSVAVYRDSAPGRYVAFCLVGYAEIVARQTIDYPGGFLEVEMPLPQPQLADHFVLRVVDGANRPLDATEITMRMQGGHMSQGKPVMRLATGEYWLRRVPPRNYFREVPADPGPYLVSVTHETLGRRVVAVALDAAEVTVRLGARSTLVVHLDNLPEASGAMQFAAFPQGVYEGDELRPRAGRGPQIPTALQARNEYTFHPGPVVLLLRLRVDQYSTIELHRQVIELGQQPQEVRIAVPPTGALRVAMPEGERGYVTLIGPGINLQRQPGPDGILTFDTLPYGEYSLRGAGGIMRVPVPSAGDVAFVPLPFDGLRVRTLDKQGVMQAAGLQQGDILRAVNGAPLRGMYAPLLALFRAPDAEAISLSVERQGRMLTLTADAARWRTMEGYWLEGVRTAD